MSHEVMSGVFVEAPWWWQSETDANGVTLGGRAILNATPMTLAEAIERSGIGAHETVAERLYVQRNGVYIEVPHRLLRNGSDESEAAQYAVVGESFALNQYGPLAAQLQPIEDKLGVRFYAAGLLGTGGRAWVAGKLDDVWIINHRDGRSDEHLDHINAQFCHDTSHALSVYPSAMRIVCANTFAIAQRDEERFGHRVKQVGDVEGRFGIAVDELVKEFETMRERRSVFQELANTPMSEQAAGDFFARLLAENAGTRDRVAAVTSTFVATEHSKRQEIVGMLLDAVDLKASESRAVRESMGVGKGLDLPAKTANLFANRYDRLMSLFSDGKGNAGADSYDALNAVTEWVDHDGVAAFRGESAHAAGKRFESAVAGDGATIKARAFEILVESVKVAA